MNRAQFEEQLVDYLYGELREDDARAFEGYLAESKQARDEVDAMRETLRLSRRGLRSLEEAPPSHLHAAIVEAAQDRKLVRGPWAGWRSVAAVVPALAVAAAVAFAVLGPQRPDPQRMSESELAQQTAAPAAPAPEAPRAEAARDEGAARSAESLEEPAAKGSGAPAPTPSKAKAPERKRAASRGGFARPPADYVADKKLSEESAREAPGLGRAEAEQPALPAAPMDDESVGGFAGAGAAAPSAPAPARAKKDSPAAASAEARTDVARAPDELVNKANEHLEARRWAEAIVAYRELAMRFPNDPRLPAWRRAQSRAASELSALR